MDAVSQKLLMETYRANAERGLSPPDWKNLGIKIHSQHDEDGYLLYIFGVIGLTSRRVIEMCCGTGKESNTANFILNHRCLGFLYDGDAECVKTAESFYRSHPNSRVWIPRIYQRWITAGEANALIVETAGAGDVDLLSIDLDGIDYWLWKAITVVSPRVVVAEINHLWGPDVSVTVPYADDFKAVRTRYGSDYAGASIAAFNKLAADKGYRLVGGNAIGTNVFYVRDDIQHPWLPEVSPQSLFWHPRTEFGRMVRLPGVSHMQWLEV